MFKIKFSSKSIMMIVWATIIAKMILGISYAFFPAYIHSATAYYWLKKLPFNGDLDFMGAVLVILTLTKVVALVISPRLFRICSIIMAGISGAVCTSFIMALLTHKLDVISPLVLWGYFVVIDLILSGQIILKKVPQSKRDTKNLKEK